MPIALVELIHFCEDRVKVFKPASFLNPSNSTPLKLVLCSCSHKPTRYRQLLDLINILKFKKLGLK